MNKISDAQIVGLPSKVIQMKQRREHHCSQLKEKQPHMIQSYE